MPYTSTGRIMRRTVLQADPGAEAVVRLIDDLATAPALTHTLGALTIEAARTAFDAIRAVCIERAAKSGHTHAALVGRTGRVLHVWEVPQALRR